MNGIVFFLLGMNLQTLVRGDSIFFSKIKKMLVFRSDLTYDIIIGNDYLDISFPYLTPGRSCQIADS